MDFLFKRLREASTWRGIIVLVCIFTSYSISSEMQEQIIVLGTAAIALIEVIRKEKANAPQTDNRQEPVTGDTQTITSPELNAEQRQAYGLD